MRPASVSFALLLAVASCRSEADEARRAEAGRVAEAIRKVREAPNAGKAELLSALRATGCETPDVCELRARCIAAYSAEVTAFDAIAAVRRSITEGNAPPEAPALLERSEAGLREAVVLTKQCADSEAETRRRHSF